MNESEKTVVQAQEQPEEILEVKSEEVTLAKITEEILAMFEVCFEGKAVELADGIGLRLPTGECFLITVSETADIPEALITAETAESAEKTEEAKPETAETETEKVDVTESA